MVQNKTFYIYLIYGLVVSYALCYQFQRPIEPFLIEKLVKQNGDGGDVATTYGRVTSLFGFAQGLGSLVMGAILDRYGIRAAYVITFLACALQYWLLSISDSLTILYLSKIPGVAVAGFLCAQTAIAKLTDEGQERIQALGRLTTSYTMGGMVGPYLGGLIGSQGDYYLGAKIAFFGSLLSAALVLLLPAHIDNSSKNESKKKDAKSNSTSQLSWFSRVKLIFSLVGLYLMTKLITSVSNSMARSSRPLILKNEFGFDESSMGTLMSTQFAFGGFANGFLLAPLTQILGGDVDSVVKNCVLCLGGMYFVQSFIFSPYISTIISEEIFQTQAVWVFVGLCFVNAVFQYSLGTSITADTTSVISTELTGTLMGLEHSIFALAGILGPLVGTFVFSKGGIGGLSFVCGCIFIGVYGIWASGLAKKSEDHASKIEKSD